ncbi:non-ribosomal peptide synthetase [Paenibacillus aquistagni]|uniref:non-ribosomal peptide synthetase n=1 Tax=Paenibacillus aquistagni TaxID=1852522 RepID=UPI00145A3F95|nr:non-ribosomal peptide synthetase [Paenibacillus aquistagni]NMM55481.1 amino acid adenylation domain-containing protein [Paenibacillus aquistagni]
MKNLIPLTQPQERILYTQQIHPESPMFNIGGIILIHGSTNLKILIKAINLTIKLNDAFRLQLTHSSEGKPTQYLVDKPVECTEIIDFSRRAMPQACMERFFQKRFEKKIGLFNGPLYEFSVFKVDDNLYGYFVKLHHIIADGWSMQILTNAIGKMYDELLLGEYTNKVGLSYTKFVGEDQEYLQSKYLKKDKSFWNNEFSTLPENIREIHGNLEGKRKTFYLGESLTSRIRTYCQNNGITVNAFVVGLYIMYKHKHERNNDIVIGLPVLGRLGKSNKSTIGMFVNSIPFRLKIHYGDTLSDFLQKISNQIALNYRHQRYSYRHLSRDLKLNNKSLYSECVNYYGTSMCNDYGGNSSSNVEFYNGQQEYNIQLVIRDWQNEDKGYQFDIDYKTKLYTEEYIDNIFENIKHIAKQFCLSDNSMKLQDIDLIPINYLALYPEFNATQTDLSTEEDIISYFKSQVRKYPEKIALRCGTKTIHYADLDRMSDGVASFLVENSIRSREIIGIYMTRSIEAVITILGVLKAGCVFLPIDPRNKVNRLSYMLENANASALFSNLKIPDGLVFNGKVFAADEGICEKLDVEQSTYVSQKDKMAYIIYTSGSTGLPKGVVVSHSNLTNYIIWACNAYGVQSEDIWPLYSSLGFDLTITSIFTPLVSGGTIVIYEEKKTGIASSENIMGEVIKDNFCTIIKLTPSHLFLLKDELQVSTKVRKLIVGGENLQYKLAKSIYECLQNNVVIYNEYGPTETTVGCMIYRFNPYQETEIVPIGRPSANNQIFLLNEYLEPVPHGEKGEIYISGFSVSAGYINNPLLTSERFIRVANNLILYKTGDIAYFLDDSTLVCCGRSDSQVKIMGYRIEPDEVAYTLQKQDGVEAAEVVSYTDTSGQVYLCAYYTGIEFSNEQLDRLLRKYLPFYMIPSNYIWLDKLPLTQNGKVDRTSLPSPEQYKSYIGNWKTSSDTERVFLAVTEQVLNKDNINTYDNFYQIGGDSIKAVQISSRLYEKGLRLKVKDILNAANISEISKCIEVEEVPNNEEINTGFIQPVPIIEWFFKLGLQNPNRFSQHGFLTIKKPFNSNGLEDILRHMLTHHDSLRLNYDSLKDQLFYNNQYLNEPVYIKDFTNSSLQKSEVTHDINIIDQLIDRLDISQKPLIQTGMINMPDQVVWCIVIHHLAIDGVSWRIILEDLDTLIGQYKNGQDLLLPQKTSSYQKWAQKFPYNNRTNLNHLTKIQFQPSSKKKDSSTEFTVVQSELSAEETSTLFEITDAAYRITPIELMLAALMLTVPQHLDYNDTEIEVEFHGRDDIEDINIMRTVGWFTRISVMERCEVETTHETILHVKQVYRELLQQNNFTPLVSLESCKNIIRFNYLGDIKTQYNHFNFSAQQINKNEMTASIEMDLALQDGKFVCQSRIDNSISNIVGIERFSKSYLKTLLSTIEFCLQKEDVILTPSDFDMVDLTNDELQQLFEN